MDNIEGMKARTVRLDAHYEVAFHRPAFSRIASFAQIIEPIHDAFNVEVTIPSDAIVLETGNTIATASATLTLSSGLSKFEARLDGYKVHFLDLRSSADIERAKRHTRLFENAVSGFLSDGIPAHSRIVTPIWLEVDGAMEAAESFVRRFAWASDSDDPLQIGATRTSSSVKFQCSNMDDQWTYGITLDKSVLPGTHLFMEIDAGYSSGSQYNSLNKEVEHFTEVTHSVIDKLGLVVE